MHSSGNRSKVEKGKEEEGACSAGTKHDFRVRGADLPGGEGKVSIHLKGETKNQENPTKQSSSPPAE